MHYPKHLPRNNDPVYLEDMSAWSGESGGFKHVSMRLPGMQGSTVRLDFHYTEDSAATCADVRPGRQCGVIIDNVVMRGVTTTVGTPVQAAFTATPLTGVAPLLVTFTNQSTGSFNSSAWSFGDGVTSTLQNPTHVYASGTYTVTLTVAGPGGSSTETKADYVSVESHFRVRLPAIWRASPASW